MTLTLQQVDAPDSAQPMSITEFQRVYGRGFSARLERLSETPRKRHVLRAEPNERRRRRQIRRPAAPLPSWVRTIGDGLPLSEALLARVESGFYREPHRARFAVVRAAVEAGWSDEAIAQRVLNDAYLADDHGEPLTEQTVLREISRARRISRNDLSQPWSVARAELARIGELDPSPILQELVRVGWRSNKTKGIDLSIRRAGAEHEMSWRASYAEIKRLGIKQHSRGGSRNPNFPNGRTSSWDLSLSAVQAALASQSAGGACGVPPYADTFAPTCEAADCCNFLVVARGTRRFCSEACEVRTRRRRGARQVRAEAAA
jgi:hypothetical protein